jgi:hypothetical protein
MRFKMRLLPGFLCASALMFHAASPVAAQSLPSQWKNSFASWESSLDAGDGQKVRQSAEELLQRYEPQISQSNYNDQHTKVAILCVAARGAILDGDWPGAVSLLDRAAMTAIANYATASETLGNLRKQHEAKIGEWKGLIAPQEQRLRYLKSLNGLRSDQIKECAEIEIFVGEHSKAVYGSEQTIMDIDETLALLEAEEAICKKSLGEWRTFLAKEREEIQGLGSSQKYVIEKLAQLEGGGNRSKFEIISYARRLLAIDPSNEPCKKFLNSALAIK